MQLVFKLLTIKTKTNMKELWLMCNTSLYFTLKSQNEERINAGEVELFLLPSNMYKLSYCKLPQNLQDADDIQACASTSFGDQEHIAGLLTQLGQIDGNAYDKVVVWQNSTIDELSFLFMISYFFDTTLHIHNTFLSGDLHNAKRGIELELCEFCNSGTENVIPAELHQRMAAWYAKDLSHPNTLKAIEDSRFTFINKEEIGINVIFACKDTYQDVSIVANNVIGYYKGRKNFSMPAHVVLHYINEAIKTGLLKIATIEGDNFSEYSQDTPDNDLMHYRVIMPSAQTIKGMICKERIAEDALRRKRA